MENFMNPDTKDEKRDIRQVIGEAIGEASMCWSEVPSGVFDSTRAKSIVDKILDAFHLQAGMGVTRWVELCKQNAELKAEVERLKGAMPLELVDRSRELLKKEIERLKEDLIGIHIEKADWRKTEQERDAYAESLKAAVYNLRGLLAVQDKGITSAKEYIAAVSATGEFLSVIKARHPDLINEKPKEDL